MDTMIADTVESAHKIANTTMLPNICWRAVVKIPIVRSVQTAVSVTAHGNQPLPSEANASRMIITRCTSA